MPNPRNRIKKTGDTHLPDVGDEGGGDEDTLRYEPAEDTGTGADVSAPSASSSMSSMSASGYVDAAREQIRQRPVVALASAFALGYLFARI